MRAHDPLGYYARLELQPGATDQEIKAAYRRRAMALHPDRNPGRDTTEQFQAINEAFGVLSDPVARAAYNTPAQPRVPQGQPAQASPEPVKCSCCGKVSAQPRVAVYRSVKSFLLVTLRKPVAGVFCSDCARRKSLKASAITWVLGWWGFPWGPVYSVQALLDNMFGGTHPPLENARMLAYQAYCFYTLGRHDIAYAVAADALKFCRKIKPTSRQAALMNERDDLSKRLKAFLDQKRPGASPARLKNSWRVVNRCFAIHAGAFALVTAAIALVVMNAPVHHYFPPKGPMPYSAQPAVAGIASPSAPLGLAKQAPQTPPYVRPRTAPSGKPWPVSAGYLTGEPQTNMAGHSEVSIDNGQNTSDVFVKLVSLSGTVARPARQIFIPAHGNFTIKTLEPGTYDVRYQDLVSGGLSRSEPMTLTEMTNARGIEYSAVRLTLYKVRHGNIATHALSEDEF